MRLAGILAVCALALAVAAPAAANSASSAAGPINPAAGSNDPTPAGAFFTPFGPVRILDSRIGLGLSANLSAGVAAEFTVVGVAGIPVGVVAVSGNLTITDVRGGGYVSLTPAAPLGVPSTSTINIPGGDTRANGVIMPLSSTGGLWVTAVALSCAVIFDVTGYFSADSSQNSWYPLLPARILDTRSGIGLSGAFSPGVPHSLKVAGFGGVPAGATAISGNLTSVTRGAGYIALTRVPTARPGTSTLNFPSGDVRANNLVAPLADDGSVSLTYIGSGNVDVILDVTGYFWPDSAGARFVPLNPIRVLDSRIPLGLAGPFLTNKPQSLSLAKLPGGGALDPDTLAITGNLTATGVSGFGYVYAMPVAGPISTSNLNIPAGDTRANGLVGVLGAADSLVLGFQAASAGGAQLVLDLTGYFAGPAPAAAAASFVAPAPGTSETTASSDKVSWTITGAPRSVALSQSFASATSVGCGNDWTPGSTITATAGDYTFANYTPGHCYRYSLALDGNPASLIYSGIRHFPPSAAKIPVLMYHLVDPVVGNNLAGLVVDPAVFNSQMSALYNAGWRTITAADLGHRLATHAFIPDRTFVITFDDGNVDDYLYAYPILQKYGFVATFYLITNRATAGGINWDQAAEMTRVGDEIASHTVSHTDVAYYSSTASLDSLIGASRTAIETALAARGLPVQVTTFCYPYGGYSAADEAYLRSHGWTAAFTEIPGAVRAGMDMEALPRVRVPRSYSATDLIAAMNRS